MSVIKSAVQFFKSVYYEFAKVTWLGGKEVVGVTIVVVLFVIAISVFVSIVDLILGIGVGVIL